jgi:ribonuclease HII
MKGARRNPLADQRGTAALFVEPDDLEPASARRSPAQSIHHGAPECDAWTARVVAGIDEAGLGPLLGPLTIGFSAFEVPPGTEALWSALHTACTDDVDEDRERLVVADSKRVFTRTPRGERRLERTALAFTALRHGGGRSPSNARTMLEWMMRDLRSIEDSAAREPCAPAGTVLPEPWSVHLDRTLPLHGEAEAIDVAAARLGEALSRAGIELTQAGVRVVHVPELNASFAETCNKSITHWHATRTVLTHLWRAHAGTGLDLAVDRHGGRMRYAHLLAEAFPHSAIHIVTETPPLSEYVVLEHAEAHGLKSSAVEARVGPAPGLGSGPARRMRIAFAERAESTSFAVALASCLAKYARETCMDAFNAYFDSLQPGLRPTAGYVTDGRRWLADARPAIERSGLRRAEIVRER